VKSHEVPVPDWLIPKILSLLAKYRKELALSGSFENQGRLSLGEIASLWLNGCSSSGLRLEWAIFLQDFFAASISILCSEAMVCLADLSSRFLGVNKHGVNLQRSFFLLDKGERDKFDPSVTRLLKLWTPIILSSKLWTRFK
jgi:hypothetical protein